MAFKHIYAEEMIQLSGTWLDSGGKVYAAIKAIPDLASSLPRLQTAHAAVAAAAQPAASPRIAAIMDEEASLDNRHDAIIRGAWGTLTSLSELMGDDGAEFVTLRDTLLPDGLHSQLKTYRAEAGQAAQLSNRVTPAIKAQTDAILVGQGSAAQPLSAYIDEWVSLGKKLGALEDEKGQLEAEPGKGTELVKARNLWIRVVNAMVANADLAALDAETEALVFGPLRDTEQKADERTRQQAAAKAKAAKEAAEKEAAEKAAAGKEAASKMAGQDMSGTP